MGGWSPSAPQPTPWPSRPIKQYNTCFWALVKSGKTTTEAHEQLRVRPAAASHAVPAALSLQPAACAPIR